MNEHERGTLTSARHRHQQRQQQVRLQNNESLVTSEQVKKFACQPDREVIMFFKEMQNQLRIQKKKKKRAL